MTTKPSPTCAGIIFDLDGTLIDSAPDIAASINTYFATRHWPLVDVDVVAQYMGHGTQRLVQDILRSLGLPHDAATVDASVAGYMDVYQRHPVRHTRLYPFVADDLRALHENGFKLGVCTNKQQGMTQQVLRALHLDTLFSAVVGADCVPACKPDPAHLFATARRMGLNGADWVYVGDSQVDQCTAEGAQVPFYAVPWGTGAALEVAASHRLSRLRDLGERLKPFAACSDPDTNSDTHPDINLSAKLDANLDATRPV